MKGDNFYVTMVKKRTSFSVWKGRSFYLKQLKNTTCETLKIFNARLGLVFLENSSYLRRSTYQTILCALLFGTWFKLLTLIPLVTFLFATVNLEWGNDWAHAWLKCIYHTSDIFFEEEKNESENFVKLGRNNENNFNFIAISMKLWSSKKYDFYLSHLLLDF